MNLNLGLSGGCSERKPTSAEAVRGKREVELGWMVHRDGPQSKYLRFTLYKENMDTMSAIAMLARFMHIKPGIFQYAGTKDRRACTSQEVAASSLPLSLSAVSMHSQHRVYRACTMVMGAAGRPAEDRWSVAGRRRGVQRAQLGWWEKGEGNAKNGRVEFSRVGRGIALGQHGSWNGACANAIRAVDGARGPRRNSAEALKGAAGFPRGLLALVEASRVVEQAFRVHSSEELPEGVLAVKASRGGAGGEGFPRGCWR
ncbi:hypothetical protein CYMTET_24949 [Cymbomonas tetramitiformis]|uniref:Uncharacterized protein n=1 Tax=Cymbomonas tetramitiformis TaxID=36881 RepID=A0AAE0FUS7_9CHLO|nr:hypothetical protein CYMTET_24949 [Cymbomonas tetramitiformis]